MTDLDRLLDSLGISDNDLHPDLRNLKSKLEQELKEYRMLFVDEICNDEYCGTVFSILQQKAKKYDEIVQRLREKSLQEYRGGFDT